MGSSVERYREGGEKRVSVRDSDFEPVYAPAGVRFSPELKLLFRHVPMIGNAWAEYVDDCIKREQDRLRRVAEEFEVASGASFQDLLEAVKGDEQLADLMADVITAATEAGSTKKLKALGRALAAGYLANDEAAVDVSRLLVTIVADMDPAHVKVLDYLATRGARHKPVYDYELAGLFPNGVTVIYGLLKRLESLGLAGPTTAPSENPDEAIGWVPWDLGLLLHMRLLVEGHGASGN
jgi:hypothetical protein